MITSAGDAVHSVIAPGPALVVATPGAEPHAPDGYGARCCWTAGHCSAARICAPPRTPCADGWGRGAGAFPVRGRVVAVVAESAIPTVQALINRDPVGHAEAELAARTSVGLPPAVHMAAVDGSAGAADALIETAELPEDADLLGPVDLPPGVRRPPATAADEPAIRVLIRVRRRRVWRWLRRCGKRSRCTVRGTTTRRSGCRSTHCTSAESYHR